MSHNRKWIVVVVVVAVAVILAAASGVFGGHAHNAAVRAPSVPKRSADRPGPLRPVYNPPSGADSGSTSGQQQADNAKLAAANDHPAEWAAVNALHPPAPAPSRQFPAIAHTTRQNPDSYATAFVTELLSISFAKQSRSALLAWAVSETSPDTMPGTPASAAPKVLYAYLTGVGSPIPTATTWADDASADTIWAPADLAMTTCPTWTQALATGWQPPDPRMECLDVTGNLTVTHTGAPPAVRPFSLQLGLGTAEYHHGYGAMSVNGWTVG